MARRRYASSNPSLTRFKRYARFAACAIAALVVSFFSVGCDRPEANVASGPVEPDAAGVYDLSAIGTEWRVERESGWQTVRVGANFFRENVFGPRLRWRTAGPPDLGAALAAPADHGGPLAIYTAPGGDAVQFRFRTVGATREPGKTVHQIDVPEYGHRVRAVLPAMPAATGQDLELELELELELMRPGRVQVWHGGGIRIGPADEVLGEARREEMVDLLLIGIYVTAGLYHLWLWLWRKTDRHYLYFGVFCTLVGVYWFMRSITSQDWLPIGGNDRSRIELVSLYALGPLFMLSLSQLLFRRLDRVALAYAGVCSVFAGITVFASMGAAWDALSYWHYTVVIVIPYTIYFVLRAAFRGNLDAIFLALGVVLQLVAAVHDILATRNILDTPPMGRYTFLIVVLGVAAVLARRFMLVYSEVEALNLDLEAKVSDRTRALQRSFEKVQALKRKQDGDYFLTSLLLRPLSNRRVPGSNVGFEV